MRFLSLPFTFFATLVIEAGLSLFQHIYGDKTKALETLRFLSYSRMQMIAKKTQPIKATTVNILCN